VEDWSGKFTATEPGFCRLIRYRFTSLETSKERNGQKEEELVRKITKTAKNCLTLLYIMLKYALSLVITKLNTAYNG